MIFTHSGYKLRFVQKRPINEDDHIFSLIFTFISPVTKYKYILIADFHTQDLFAIKFYCSKDKKSEFKYSNIINKGDAMNIFATCASVIPILLIDYPKASFGLCASRSIDRRTLLLEPVQQNQRFKIYSCLIKAKFGSQTFTHFQYPQISSYLLINNDCEDVVIKERAIIVALCTTYPNLPDISSIS